MIVKEIGEICSGFYMTGSPGTPVYLVDGEVPALFDAGLSAGAFMYEQSIREILGERAPGLIFLSHSHFDHIGSVSLFKRAWPGLQVAGSEKCHQVLQKSKAVELMRFLSREGVRTVEEMGVEPVNREPFEPFGVDLKVAGGQVVKLGDDLHVEVISTPGHTWDFLSYWIPEKKVLVASESVACREDNAYLQPEFLVDINAYLDSLRKLEALEPEVVCAGHYSVFTGADAIGHIQGSIQATLDYRDMTEQFLTEENLDVDRAVARVKAFEWDDRPWPKQPESAYVINTKQRVMTVLAAMTPA